MNIDAINNLLRYQGVTAKFVPADDCTVDDEIALYVENHAEAPAGIQLSGRYYCANVWTSAAMDEMEHAPQERNLNVAIVHALRLMSKYGWIER